MKNLPWVLVAALLAACSILPKPPPPPALHDFGPPTSAPTVAGGPTQIIVSAPAWLDDTAIYYRLLYSDATHVRNYADNRWLAPPAELLQARLRAAFAADNAHYRLQVRLLDFEQVLDTAQSAHISLRALVDLQDLSDGKTVNQQLFTLSVPVSPDVQGAVSGGARAADELITRLTRWTQAQIDSQP